MEAQAKAQYEKNLEFLRTKQEQGWESFNKLKNASETAWGQFKADMDKAGEDIKSAAERLTAQVKT